MQHDSDMLADLIEHASVIGSHYHASTHPYSAVLCQVSPLQYDSAYNTFRTMGQAARAAMSSIAMTLRISTAAMAAIASTNDCPSGFLQ